MKAYKFLAIIGLLLMICAVAAAGDPVFTGIFQKTSNVTYNTSNISALGSTLVPAQVSSLSATVTPTYSAAPYAKIPTTNLVAWWKFDDGSGVNVYDSSGYDNNCTATDMKWVNGKYNTSGYFNGVSSRIISTKNITMSNSVTIIATVNLTNGSALKSEDTLITEKGIVNNRDIDFFLIGTKPAFVTAPGNGTHTMLNYNTNVPTNCSTFLAINVNGTNATIWVQNSTTNTLMTESKTLPYTITARQITTLYIGGVSTTYPNTLWTGTIDNLMVYNRSLTDAEMKQIYYDQVQNLTLATNSNTSQSSIINVSRSASIPYSASDASISSIKSTVPTSVNIGGVTVNNYTDTISPFTLTTNAGYTENGAVTTETSRSGKYALNATFTPSIPYLSGGFLNYTTTDTNITSSTWQSSITTTSNDAAATTIYNNTTKQFTTTSGALAAKTKYSYNLSDIYAIAPIASFTTNVSSGNVPFVVQFNDTSTYLPTSWLWNYSDGTTNDTTQNITHAFKDPGNYSVSLNATNLAGSNVTTQWINVTDPIVAIIEHTTNTSTLDLTKNTQILFSVTSTYARNISWWTDGVTQQWNNSTNSASFTYTFPNIELNTTNVTVIANNLNSSTQYTWNYEVYPVVLAAFHSDVTSGNAPLDVSFTDISSGSQNTWLWDFGDGQTSILQNPTHTYATAGIYNVSLLASNPANSNYTK